MSSHLSRRKALQLMGAGMAGLSLPGALAQAPCIAHANTAACAPIAGS
ncbi:hypothetical protein IP90_02916 [Luteimonas cucumeris]|uniref:Secreted protein n=1 Tax=Luteimonas cucumeris TaxID=985012 RepID=A0A562KY64_9GAMM|nr:hypothetical protein [Luteimonas cucumeris]TWI00370.1 hypothetical protein IP90_02916 [Luteimonas cucumeris]